MRHSSWTLFLVPLVVALVIVCMPGAMRTTTRTDSLPEDKVEVAEENRPVLSEDVTTGFGSGGDTFQDSSESLYK